MPPLRDRRGDIPLLASHFLAKYGTRFERRFIGLSSEARTCLMSYDWPGNVRELENAIERAVVLGSADLIRPEDLLEAPLPKSAPASVYHKAVREAKGNFTEAARSLGVHSNHLHRLMRNLKLNVPPKN